MSVLLLLLVAGLPCWAQEEQLNEQLVTTIDVANRHGMWVSVPLPPSATENAAALARELAAKHSLTADATATVEDALRSNAVVTMEQRAANAGEHRLTEGDLERTMATDRAWPRIERLQEARRKANVVAELARERKMRQAQEEASRLKSQYEAARQRVEEKRMQAGKQASEEMTERMISRSMSGTVLGTPSTWSQQVRQATNTGSDQGSDAAMQEPANGRTGVVGDKEEL